MFYFTELKNRTSLKFSPGFYNSLMPNLGCVLSS